MKKQPIIILADPGIDDAIALMLATKTKKFDIKMVGCSAGNIGVLNSSANTLGLLDLYSAPDMPISAGSEKPLVRKSFPEGKFHGDNGMGGYVFEKTKRSLSKKPTFELMHHTLNETKDKITIITLCPLTDLALLIKNYPEDKDRIEQVIMMIGSVEEDGIKTPYTEFNIACDPEAGEVVLSSGLNLVVVPMELGHTAYLDWREVFETKTMSATGATLEFIYRGYKDRHIKNGIATHDATAMAYALAPEIFTKKQMNVAVQYFDEVKTGVIICKDKNPTNATVLTNINIKAFKKLYFKALKSCK
ncbi:MAG: nucleoside hydrolase [Clostridia bacterium]|nr:nucleoside hydrolase [Clostridia bacterium]